MVVWDFFHQQYLQTCGQFYFYRNGMHMWIVSTTMHWHWLKSKKDRKQMFFSKCFDMTSFISHLTQRTLFSLKKGRSFPFKVLSQISVSSHCFIDRPDMRKRVRVGCNCRTLRQTAAVWASENTNLRIWKQTRRSFHGPSHQILYQDSVAYIAFIWSYFKF